MSTKTRIRKSSKLALYGVAFRILCSVALRTPTQQPGRAPRPRGASTSALHKGRSPLPLKLDAGR